MRYKHLLANKKLMVAIAVALVLILCAGGAIYANSKRNDNYVARVDGVGIAKTSFDQQLGSLQHFYKQSNQQISLSTLQMNVLDTLIDNQLVQNYAAKNNIVISQDAIRKSYQQRVSAFINEQDFLAELKKLYNIDKVQYQETIKNDILRDNVQQAVKKPLDIWLTEQRKSAKIIIYITI